MTSKAPLLVFLLACGAEAEDPPRPDPTTPSEERRSSPEAVASTVAPPVIEPVDPLVVPTTPRRSDVDELVFPAHEAAAYDRSGRGPAPRAPRGPDEDYTPDPYEFRYEDVPGLEGIRVPTNHVTVVLRRGNARDAALRLAESEGGEIVGQIPGARWYDLRLPTTTFEAVAAAVERLRVRPEVQIVTFEGEDEVARGRAALAE